MQTENKRKSIIILGSGIGGLSSALELLERGFRVTIVEKNDRPGGIMQSIIHEDYIVEIGFRRYYGRIPEVVEFFKKILGKDFIPYEHRIGVVYKNKIYEREPRFKGYSRGLPYSLIIKGLIDLIINRIKYTITKPTNFEQSAYLKKGKLFSKILAQSYYEKLKGVFWRNLPSEYRGERHSNSKNIFSFNFLKRITQKIDDQYQWFHPRLGSYSLINKLYSNVKDHGANFSFNTIVKSFSKLESGKWQVKVICEGIQLNLEADTLISALPIEISSSLLLGYRPNGLFRFNIQRNVLIIYLFLDQEVLFPHNCLRVTDESSLIARITNYGSYNGDMVPENKGCIGLEIFCSDQDSILNSGNVELYDLAVNFCLKANLIEPTSISNYLIKRYFNTQVASSWEDYREDENKMNIFIKMTETPDFFQINRTGIDKTIYAAIETAKAIEKENQLEYRAKTMPDINEPWKSILPFPESVKN